MQSKLFLLVPNFLFFVFVTNLNSQTNTDSVQPSETVSGEVKSKKEKADKYAHIRFWNMTPMNGPALDLIANGKPIATQLPWFSFTYYFNVEPQKYELSVINSSNSVKAIGKVSADLKAAEYITVVAVSENGTEKVFLIDDTYDKKTETGILTIHNFMENTIVDLDVPNVSEVTQIGFNQSKEINGLSLSMVPFNLEATLPNGQKTKWSSQANLELGKKMSLLIMGDRYGRFAPRMVLDGWVRELEEEEFVPEEQTQ